MARTILNLENPVTQSIDSVRALLAYLHRPADPLPSFVELQNSVRLTLSKDKKAYYVTTAKECSCPARAFNPARHASIRGSTSLRKSSQQHRAGLRGRQMRRAASGRCSISHPALLRTALRGEGGGGGVDGRPDYSLHWRGRDGREMRDRIAKIDQAIALLVGIRKETSALLSEMFPEMI